METAGLSLFQHLRNNKYRCMAVKLVIDPLLPRVKADTYITICASTERKLPYREGDDDITRRTVI